MERCCCGYLDLPASSDKIHYLTILTSSIYHKFLNVDLRIKFFHMDHEDYRFALSFFLCLPFPSGPHYNGTCMNDEYGYHLVNCSRCNLKVDANGDHAARCPNAFLGRWGVHAALIRACIHFLKKAEFTTTFEPSLTLLIGTINGY